MTECSLRFRSALVSFGLALFLAGTLSVPSYAQIAADRPGFGNAAATVGGGTFQTELGYAFNGNGINSHELGQLLLRFGVTEAIELRGGVNSYVVNESPVNDGYNGTDIGTKVRFVQTPTSTLSGVATLRLPTQTGAFDTPDDRARQQVALAFDGALGETITLSVNAGTTFLWSSGEQEDRFFTALFIPTLSFAVSEQTGAYVGYAGEYTKTFNANFVEGGLTYLTGSDTQLDVNTGLRIDDNGDAFFLGLGLAHRF